jgi:hypothetical protein
MKNLLFLAVICFVLSGCTSLNSSLAEKTKQIEYYRVFDIKTNAKRSEVSKAASTGLAENVGNANETMPIPTFSTPPEEPGRFKVVNMSNQFQGNLGAIMAMSNQGLGLKKASCEDAVWTADARKTVKNSWNLNLTSCLFEYKEGYHLDMYAHFTKQEGGLIQVSRAMANAMVGTPEEWVEKTFLDVVRTINQETVSEIIFIEGYPEVQGTPWLDSGERFAAKK